VIQVNDIITYDEAAQFHDTILQSRGQVKEQLDISTHSQT
jgi:hypothetical protein